MSSTAIVITGMGVAMAIIGIVIVRLSKRDRGAGIAFVLIGITFVVGYYLADDTAPLPGSGTPTPELPFSFPISTEP